MVSSCSDNCDNYFKICLTRPTSSRCSLGNTKTENLGQDSISFGNNARYTYNFPKWEVKNFLSTINNCLESLSSSFSSKSMIHPDRKFRDQGSTSSVEKTIMKQVQKTKNRCLFYLVEPSSTVIRKPCHFISIQINLVSVKK